MDQTLKQLGELLLGSIPTVIFLLLTFALYTIILHKPLVKVLAERRAKTEGAIEKAKADVAAAEACTAEYEQRMREARLTVFKAQEARRQQANQVRTNAVAEAKAKAQKQVEAARAGIEKEKAEAQAGLTAEAGKLATEMIRTVLSPAGTMRLLNKFHTTFAWMLLLLILAGITPRLHAAEQPKLTPGQERSKELQEAEEEGTAAFKHSSSVKMVAKLTGLSIENAYWLCVIGNFAIVAGVLVWALRKNLPTVFRNRTASIQQAMAEARAASEDANRRLADIESRLSRLDGEIAEMRISAEKEGAAEEERIKAATADEMKKVVESAEQEIAAAGKNARRDLRAYAANLVVSLAEKQIKVDAATDQALVQGFAKRLASDGASPRDSR